VNLKDPHPIEGNVSVEAPIPHSATRSLLEVVVAPAARDEPSLWTEADPRPTASPRGAELTDSSGNPAAGAVGLVLIPERERSPRSRRRCTWP
jgi:hypothetical protein